MAMARIRAYHALFLWLSALFTAPGLLSALAGPADAPATGRLVVRVRLPDGSAPRTVTAHLKPMLPQLPPAGSPQPQTRSGADGKLLFESVSCRCDWELWLEGKGFVSETSYDVHLLPGREVTRSITVYRGGTLEGRVVRAEDGRPIGGARLLLEGQRPPVETRSGADGGFRLAPALPGRHSVACEAKGFVRATSSTVVVRDGQLTRGANVALRRAGSITGVVLLPDGKPAAGAIVRLTPEGDARSFTGAILGEFVTGADGRFRCDSEPPGSYTLTAEWPPMTKSRQVPPTHRGILRHVRVRATRATRVKVVVAPVDGAKPAE